jgi:hypothetical protein
VRETSPPPLYDLLFRKDHTVAVVDRLARVLFKMVFYYTQNVGEYSQPQIQCASVYCQLHIAPMKASEQKLPM